jgi:hypothetical protein
MDEQYPNLTAKWVKGIRQAVVRLLEARALQSFRQDYERAGLRYGPEWEGLTRWTQECVLNDMQQRASQSEEERQER